MKHILYLITRDDDKKYVGITIDYRIKQRMAQHRHSSKFRGHSFTFKILLENEDRNIIEEAETKAVQEYDTFNNGLNATFGGKGHQHNSKKFNTLGFRFSEKSKEKMSQAAKARAKREGYEIRSSRSRAVWKDLSRRKRLSEKKKGQRSPLRKISDSDLQGLRANFNNFNDSSIGATMKNGKILTKARAFANLKAKEFGMTGTGMYGYIKKFTN